MRVVLLLACLMAPCLAEKPHPCESPALLTGLLTVATQNEKLSTYAKYLYDALGQRVRLMELGTYENKSFTYDALLLYREVGNDAGCYGNRMQQAAKNDRVTLQAF